MHARSSLKFIAIALISLSLCLLAAVLPVMHSLPSAIAPALAQFDNRSADLQRVYQQVPDLPLENQYVSRLTGEVAENNTLVSRLIQYHVYVQGRAVTSRLDWKLTLADLLGMNQWVVPGLYPSADTLQQNPLAGDTAAIDRLNRTQRDALVDAIVSLFAAPTAAAPASPVAAPTRQVPAEPNAAQLLQP